MEFKMTGSYRIGYGYDCHRLAGGGPLVLGGLHIDAGVHAVGHSDADVVLHALTDACLGAIAAPDIGEQFPPSDPQHKGRDSRFFLQAALKQVHEAGYRVGNCDITVILDQPKLGSYKAGLRKTLADLLGIEPGCVGVKAKTTEGFEPRTEGIVAHAVVLLQPRVPEQAER
jgi:2-C-methyl-D-erythritol 2,4-cyclodiphosphate synthase